MFVRESSVSGGGYDREKLLEAIRYLYEHYEEIWESYRKGAHIKRYIEFLKSISKLKRR